MSLEEYFKIIAKENPLEFLSKHICPYLVGTQWDLIRKCALLMGVTKDRSNMRMRLHLLLWGGPGTGKSEFLNWYQQKMDGVLINSELTSKTGLVGDARGKTIHPGLLARCNGSILLVDELDKMSVQDQNGLLQAIREKFSSRPTPKKEANAFKTSGSSKTRLTPVTQQRRTSIY